MCTLVGSAEHTPAGQEEPPSAELPTKRIISVEWALHSESKCQKHPYGIAQVPEQTVKVVLQTVAMKKGVLADSDRNRNKRAENVLINQKLLGLTL